MRITVIGSGPAGMTAAILFARQGHDIVLVDRDPGPVDGQPWKRVGVMQFHLPHAFRTQCRSLLTTRLPDLYDAYVRQAGPVDLPSFLTTLATAVARGWLREA